VFYRQQGKYTQAEALYTKVVDIQRRVLGEEHPNMLLSMNGLAVLYERQQKIAQAEALYTKVIAVQRRILGPQHPDTMNTMKNLATMRLANQKFAEAEPLLRELVSDAEKTNSDSWQRFDLQSMLGAALAGQKNYDQAEPLLLSGYDGLSKHQASIPAAATSSLNSAVERIVRLYESWNRPADAAKWKDRLPTKKP